jgi:hypothetical protein
VGLLGPALVEVRPITLSFEYVVGYYFFPYTLPTNKKYLWTAFAITMTIGVFEYSDDDAGFLHQSCVVHSVMFLM